MVVVSFQGLSQKETWIRLRFVEIRGREVALRVVFLIQEGGNGGESIGSVRVENFQTDEIPEEDTSAPLVPVDDLLPLVPHLHENPGGEIAAQRPVHLRFYLQRCPARLGNYLPIQNLDQNLSDQDSSAASSLDCSSRNLLHLANPESSSVDYYLVENLVAVCR